MLHMTPITSNKYAYNSGTEKTFFKFSYFVKKFSIGISNNNNEKNKINTVKYHAIVISLKLIKNIKKPFPSKSIIFQILQNKLANKLKRVNL